ncbi:hypothetical protein [Actinoplanes utahensis]|uniref:Uncharacterized protein n=2 Tax=Actinoplanes utahensis TaxID=1869 RepID=A0A0A6UB70_ACTUT|nr:hypothetical protein [Actinoplanes utahensis]KHD72283.1 hypothetical protein MB27_41255 [Actinoplanes utahensis]
MSEAIDVFRGVRKEQVSKPEWKPGTECRSWTMLNEVGVAVCADAKGISEIEVHVPAGQDVYLASDGGTLTFPNTLAGISKQLTDFTDYQPYALEEFDGEGDWRQKHSWHYRGSEGIVLADIHVNNSTSTPWNLRNDNGCDYQGMLGRTEKLSVQFVEVTRAGEDQLPGEECPAVYVR